MDLNRVHILDLQIPHNINYKIMDLLAQNRWFRGGDTDEPLIKSLELGRSFGWGVETMNNGNINTPLDIYADFIFQIILKKLNINGTITRCLWNLYFPGDFGEFHIDKNEKDHFSAIYPLHTTDGFTIIKDELFNDKEGFVKVFPSNFLHKGVGPKNSKFRMNLNLVFKL